jgi:hypothetical protein
VRRAETAVAAILVLFGLLMIRQALKLPVGWTPSGPGSGFFPFWLSIAVTLSGAVILTQTVMAPKTEQDDEVFIPTYAWRPLLIAFLPMVAIIAAMGYLGIYIGGGLYLAGYMRFVGRFRWMPILLISILVPLVLFFIFEKWFLLPLPKGALLEYLLYGR